MSPRLTPPAPDSLKSRRALVVGLAATCLATAGWAAPAHAESIAELERQGLTRIIVKRDRDLSASERADVRADADVDLVRRLTLPDAELVEAAPGDLVEAVAALRDDPDVSYAEPDAPVSGVAVDFWWNDLWGLENGGQSLLDDASRPIAGTMGSVDADVDAPEAWRTSTGAGQTVAVIDSGLEASHPDLVGSAAVNPGEAGARAANGEDDDGNGFVDDFRGWDWVGRTNAGSADQDNHPADLHGHGTHVAGIIAARRDNGIGIAGIAPDAQVLALRVLGADNTGVLSDAVEAFHYAGEAGVRVANASLGLQVPLDHVRSLQEAIGKHPGTLYVVAAGNEAADNDAAPFYPCALPEENVVCVGASDNHDRLAYFSSYGAKSVDLFAPGQRIRSTHKGGYTTLNGSSMASPFVAGAAALVAAARPSLDAAALKRRVLDSADPKAAFAGYSVTGGRLNAAAAVKGLAIVAPVRSPAPEPAAPTPTPTPAPATTVPVIEADPALEPTPPATPPAAAETPRQPIAPAATPTPHAAPPAPVAFAAVPVLSRLTLSARTLRRTVTMSFQLDRSATVRLTLSRKLCRNRRCSYKSVRTVALEGRAGANRHRLHRGTAGRRLVAGSYRLSARAHDGARRSTARTVAFSVR